MKSGWKTTEFWLALVSIIVSIWFAIQNMIPAAIVMEVVKWVGVAYIVARTIVKATPTIKDDEILEKIELIVKEKKK